MLRAQVPATFPYVCVMCGVPLLPRGNYPPAEPGALGYEPLKAAEDALPDFFLLGQLSETSPRCRRNSTRRLFLEHLGTNRTSCLRSHLVRPNLSYPPIDLTPFRALCAS